MSDLSKSPAYGKGPQRAALRSIFLTILMSASGCVTSAQAAEANEVVGTWRMVSAQLDPGAKNLPAYGEQPKGMLIFTPDMHFVEVLTDADTPRFASNVRGEGTDAENRAAMAAGIGFFGTYTVDRKGAFSGNRVEASTFPNWVGSTRSRRDLTLEVSGDRMFEHFQRPDGTKIYIEWHRVR